MQNVLSPRGLGSAILLCGALFAQAAAQPAAPPAQREPTAPPKPGDAGPDFELKGIDGKTYRLSDYRDKIVVLEWVNEDCPFSNYKAATGVGPKSRALAQKYREQGVVWFGIDSTRTHTPERIAQYAKENSVPYPLLPDPDGKVGQRYQATNTPHVFVINKGRVAYAGAFDNDQQKTKDPDEYRNYVAAALDAVLAGQNVSPAYVKPWGCTIKYAPARP